MKNNKGFSLVELIVCIAIVVILISLLVPQLAGYIVKAKRAAVISQAKSIYTAAIYYISEETEKGHTVTGNTIDLQELIDKKQVINCKASSATVHLKGADGETKVVEYVEITMYGEINYVYPDEFAQDDE